MNEIKINMENLSDTERDQLLALIKKANKPKSKVWKPEYDEKYWNITDCGNIYQYINTGSSFDKKSYEIGNMFATKEEAEEELTRRKILTQWKRLSIETGEDENLWDVYNEHWFVIYNTQNNNIDSNCLYYAKRDSTSFPTKGSLLSAIQTIGEDNVKRYILNVKEN